MLADFFFGKIGSATLYCGDALAVLKALPDESVQCCVTSPPYWGLRNYGVEGQIGLEASPLLYVDALVDVCREIRRVLRDDGTLWLNLGDSYANDGKWGGSTSGKHVSALHGNSGVGRGKRLTGLKPKDLVGVPWCAALALRADGWWLRSDIIWAKPNPMPESVTDRPTRSHEYVFLLTKSERYYYDAEAVKESLSTQPNAQSRGPKDTPLDRGLREGGNSGLHGMALRMRARAVSGRNRRSVWRSDPSTDLWELPTRPFKGAHFAVFPPDLVRPCLLAGTSEHGACVRCGAPWKRETKTSVDESRPLARRNILPPEVTKAGQGTNSLGSSTWGHYLKTETLGWQPTCECGTDETVPCVVLDPFIGSGTTAVVARDLGRRAIGIDLNPEYLTLARDRLRAPARIIST